MDTINFETVAWFKAKEEAAYVAMREGRKTDAYAIWKEWRDAFPARLRVDGGVLQQGVKH